MKCIRIVMWVVLLGMAPPLFAEELSASPESGTAAPTAPQGILPVPDYTGDIWSRPRLSGDWGGTRTDWANKGFQLDVDWTQTVQSVVDGGKDRQTKYGGGLDYNATLDLMRMGVLPGALVKFRAESRYGEAANDISGSVLPVNTDGLFPLTNELDDDVAFTITTLSYLQFLSPKLGVMLGKMDTMDGDANEFASGRGTSQFMNGNFVFPTSPLLMAPYSTLGAGIIVLPAPWVTVSSLVYNIADSSTTTGFEDFGKGTAWLTEAQFKYRLGKLPGGQNVGFGYAFDSEFSSIGDRFVFSPGSGLTKPTTDETWAVYWSAWQYLCVEEESDAPIDLTNGEQDRQGLGLFARVGFADHDTNPIEWSASGGVGAKGLIPGRDRDTLGAGYFYLKIQETRLSGLLGVDNHSQGFEAFYNLSVTPAANLTLDLQVVDSPLPNIDTAVVLGARFRLRF